MDVEAGRSDNARFAYNRLIHGFWMQKIDAPDMVFGNDVFDESSIVTIHSAANWTGGTDTGPLLGREGAPDHCVHCVTRTAVVELQITQNTFDYFCARLPSTTHSHPIVHIHVHTAHMHLETAGCSGCRRSPAS
jgi:hypothetical protein